MRRFGVTVFSDNTILARIGQLIDKGDPKRVRGCAYSFVAGKIFPSPQSDGAAQKRVVDWTTKATNDWPGEEVYEVCPGELVSLRTRERVKMPTDVCGIWNQTDALSRKGMLLVNLSAVPPGYEGHLTCTFVNFGKQRVRIQPDTRVAKLMFLSLDQVAKYPSAPWETQGYDGALSAAASEAPATFLQISDQSRALKELIASGAAQIEKAVDEFSRGARAGLSAELDSAKANFRESVTTDSRGAVFKAAPIALVAIFLLAGGQWLATKVLTENVENVAKQRADQIEARIDKQLEAARTKPVFVYSGSEESKALLERMKALEEEIKAMEAKQK
jgi:deoxycytidine triphosphate deaminase